MGDGYQRHEITALGAGLFELVPIQGTLVRILEASHDNFSIGIGGTTPTPCYRGFSFTVPFRLGKQEPFTFVKILNTDAAAALTATVLVTDGNITDDRVIIASSSLVPVSFHFYNLATGADIAIPQNTLTNILGGGTASRRLVFSSLVTNTAEIRIGDSLTTAIRGAPIQPGESITLWSEKAVYAYQANVAAQTISVLYESGL